MRRQLLLGLHGLVPVIALVAASTAGAQGAGPQPGPQPGSRVRVAAPGAGIHRMEGTLVALGDSLVLESGGTRTGIARGAVTRLELSQGSSRAGGARRGVAWGAGSGLVLGAFAAALSEYSCGDMARGCNGLLGQGTSRYLVASTVGGALWGAALGAVRGGERWDTVPLSAGAPVAARVTGQVTPWIAPGDGAGVRLTMQLR